MSYSFLNHLSHFFEFSQMVEHQIAQELVESIEYCADCWHELGFVFVHEFVHEGEDVFEEELLSSVVYCLEHCLELNQKVQTRFRKSVEDSVTEMLKNELYVNFIEKERDTPLGDFFYFWLV